MGRSTMRLHTVTGLGLAVLLGAHLVDVWPAVAGRDAWIAAVATARTGHGLGVAFVGLLCLHALLGLRRSLGSTAPAAPGGAAMARLQLATGLVVVVFVAAHLVQVGWLGDGPHRGAAHGYTVVSSALAELWVLLGYLVGITAAVFHVAHGASRIPFAWGLSSTPRNVRIARYVAGIAGAVLWLGWLEVLSHLAIGTGLVDRGR